MSSDMLLERLKQIESSQMTFFVGAGVSKDSRLPDFPELSKNIIQDIVGDKLKQEEADYLSQNLRPEVILQIAVEELGPNVLRSLHRLMGHRPNSNHFFLAEAIHLGNWVFTTNQDNLIEEAGRLMNINFERCYIDQHFEEFERRLLARGDVAGCLFKLHGTVEEDKQFEERYRTILMALRQVGRGLSEPKRRILSYFLQRFDFCFMGYSCQDDFSVTPVLLNTASDRSAFWLSYARGPMEEPLSNKDSLQHQKEVEESKTPGEKRNWETINVNSFILKRDKAFKFVGDSSRFVEDTVCPDFGIDTGLANRSEPAEEQDEEYVRWILGISSYKRNLIAGRLYQSLYDLEKSESFYKQGHDSARGVQQRAIALRRLGQVYLIPSTRDGDERAIETFQEALTILNEPDDSFEMVSTKTDLSNVLRRRRRFPEATKYIEEANQMFQKDILPSDGKEDEDHTLAYSRCLNVFGLVHFGLGADSKSEEHLQTGLKLCEKGRWLKEKFGDVDGVAESDNASALILIEQARLPGKSKQKAARLLNTALGNLERAINARERIGNFRGCFQQCRNLGLAHSRMANLAVDRSKKERYTRLVRKDYEDGMSYLNRIRPEPPPGEILECQFRIGELDVQLGEMEDAIKWLEPVESKRRELGDWHNRVRTLDLLREAYVDVELKKRVGSDIISIYQEVLASREKIKEMRDTKIKLTNAKDILQRTAGTFVSIGFSGLADEVLRIHEELVKAVE